MSETGGRAYEQRKTKREDRGRDQVRDTYQRMLVGSALRRELHALGSGERDGKAGLDKSASSISEAIGDSAIGRWASGRLDARRKRAAELYELAASLGVADALRLWELEPADLRALGLYGEDGADA